MMLPNLTKIGILIDFKINRDFIATVLCINKEKPLTMCNGKCYLSEQLKKAEEQEEQQAPTSKKERLEVVYYFIKNPLASLFLSDRYSRKLNHAYKSEFYRSSFAADIFRPPKLNLI
jgi:hypothetical protein